MNVFARSLDDNLASLAKKIDQKIRDNTDQNLAGFLVLLTEDPDSAEAQIKIFAEKHGIEKLPLTIFDGSAGPDEYNIAQEADVTVNMWVELEVQANHAFAKNQLDKDAIDAVMADTDKILE